ncbi:MAG: replication-relaxation family protein [Clostridia bacterium]|nr:replication-relaxation family protein [Clostridia bacterium]
MVEDNEIKAEVSPFAVRKGEIKTFDGKDGYVSMNQILHKINLGHINELHFAILELVNEFEFITSRQLLQMLEWKKIEVASQDKLNNKLEQLVKSKILTRYYFTSEEGKGIYRVYCLEKMGKYLLNSREIECKWQPADNAKPVPMIKKRLAGNQTIIAYLRKVKAFEEYKCKPSLNAKVSGKVFKATGGSVKLTKNKKSISFVFEVIRREQEWEKKLVDKIKLYHDFYENFVTMDSGFENVPQLIFVCEDDRHSAEVFKTIVMNKLELPKIKLLFTTDLKQNNETLENTLIEFKLDEATGKYKIENIELKLLN